MRPTGGQSQHQLLRWETRLELLSWSLRLNLTVLYWYSTTYYVRCQCSVVATEQSGIVSFKTEGPRPELDEREDSVLVRARPPSQCLTLLASIVRCCCHQPWAPLHQPLPSLCVRKNARYHPFGTLWERRAASVTSRISLSCRPGSTPPLLPPPSPSLQPRWANDTARVSVQYIAVRGKISISISPVCSTVSCPPGVRYWASMGRQLPHTPCAPG